LTRNLGQVLVEGEHVTLFFERKLNYSQETVWKAITDPDELAAWYMTEAKIDARQGGTIDFRAGISHFHVTGKILVWDPPRVFEHEWNVEPRRELPKGEQAVIRWELIPQEDSTVLRLTHRHLTRGTSMGFAPGTHAFLDRLEARLNNTEMPDWVMRVQEMRESYPNWNSPNAVPRTA
jgi:uncharacterized protein YndB with AHSA1/START domain